MRAAVLRDDSGMLQVEDLTIDKPEAEEVLIRTVAAGLCHSDLHFIDGTWAAPLPTLPGHEAAGIVEAVGVDVIGLAPGDHVISCLSVYCGHCNECLTGHSYMCANRNQVANRDRSAPPRLTDARGEAIPQLFGTGSFAEQALMHQNAVVKVSNEMPLDKAALIGCGVTTGVGAVFRSAAVKPGSTVAVIGCGGVGMAAIQGAHLVGATKVIAVDMDQRKLDAALTLGATHAVNAGDCDPVAQVRELTAGGVEYSFECIGLKQTSEQAFQMLRPRGLATVIGMVPFGVNIEIAGTDLFMNAKRIQGSMMGSNNFKVDMPQLVDLYLDGRLKLDEMISATMDLDHINDGFAAMKAGETVRSVVLFDG